SLTERQRHRRIAEDDKGLPVHRHQLAIQRPVAHTRDVLIDTLTAFARNRRRRPPACKRPAARSQSAFEGLVDVVVQLLLEDLRHRLIVLWVAQGPVEGRLQMAYE